MESSLFMFVAKVVRTNPLIKAVCVSVQNMELDPHVHVVHFCADIWIFRPEKR